jgi:hypothetical protein
VGEPVDVVLVAHAEQAAAVVPLEPDALRERVEPPVPDAEEQQGELAEQDALLAPDELPGPDAWASLGAVPGELELQDEPASLDGPEQALQSPQQGDWAGQVARQALPRDARRGHLALPRVPQALQLGLQPGVPALQRAATPRLCAAEL